MTTPNDADRDFGSSDCSSALRILHDEWERMQSGRYRTLTESDVDHAFYVGFNHAIELLKVKSGFVEPPLQASQPNTELEEFIGKLDIPF